MSPPLPSNRRRSYRDVGVVAMVIVLVASAGCAGLFGGSGDSGAPSGPALDTVPADVDTLVYVDVNGSLEDQHLRTIADTVYGLDDSGPQTLEEAIQQVEANTTLDVHALQSVTAFGKTKALNATDGYGAMIVTADWSTTMIVNEIENESNTTMESTQFAGRQLWQPEEDAAEASYVGKLGEHRFVIGSEQAVKDALRVDSGDRDPVSGDIRTAFQNTRSDAYVRFATAIPQDEVDPGQLPGNTDVFNQVQMVSGSQYVANDRVVANATLTFGAESAAGDAQSVIEGAIQIWRGGVVEDPDAKALIAEENLTVRHHGTDVTVSVSNTATAISAAIESFYESFLGISLGSEQAVTRAPIRG